MVAATDYLNYHHQHHQHSNTHNLFNSKPKAQPSLRYTEHDRIVGVLRVRTMLSTRRRLVRLEEGVMYINAVGDECGEPIITCRLTDAETITASDQKATITIRTKQKTSLTLVFKHDITLLYAWLAALQRARQMEISHYYKICEQIGSGHYAKVFRCVERSTGDVYAVKIVPKDHKELKVRQYIKREIEIVKCVRHANVVKTIDVFETNELVYIVMEHIENGNLLQFLAGGKNRVNEKNALRIAKQLLQALYYLHSNDILHRDIKAENILMTKKGNIKLADFGLARKVDNGGGGADEYCLSSILGTPAYCSPEVVMRLSYGKPVDLFGCGVLIYIALSGSLPFKGDTPSQVFESIAQGKITFPKSRWSMISPQARDFVRRLMSHKASDRPTAEEALRHPWLLSMDNEMNNVHGKDGERPVSPKPFLRNSSARSLVDSSTEVNRKRKVHSYGAPRNPSFYGTGNHNHSSHAYNSNNNNYNSNSMKAPASINSYSHSTNNNNTLNSNGMPMPRVNSTSSFRRAQSGSLRQLTLDKMRQRAAQLV